MLQTIDKEKVISNRYPQKDFKIREEGREKGGRKKQRKEKTDLEQKQRKQVIIDQYSLKVQV